MWASIGPRVSDDSMEICKRCLDAGPEGVIERAKKYANRLQDHVNFLTNDIPGIVRSVNTWKTGVDYKAVYDTGEAEIKKLCEEEEIEVFEPDAPDTQESQNDDIPF
jgi:Fe-S-cluster-containing hydrogenase component 2